MLILSGYGEDSQLIANLKKAQPGYVKPSAPVEEKPGFFSNLLVQTAKGVNAMLVGSPVQAQQTQTYQQPIQERPSGMFGGINPYIIYAGAGIGIIGLIFIIKKIRSKKHSGLTVNPPISTIQLPVQGKL